MPPYEDRLTWVSLNDFTPGIRQRLLRHPNTISPTPPGVNGIATRENTFGCIALPEGGLAPLPRRTTAYSRAANLETSTPTNGYYVSGLMLAGPIDSVGAATETSEMFVAYEYTTASQKKYLLERVRLFELGNPRDTLVSKTASSPLTNTWRATQFATSRSNQDDTGDPGWPIIVSSWWRGGLDFVTAFPNDRNPTSAAPDFLFNDVGDNYSICAHQGRIVLFRHTTYDHGPNGKWETNEDLIWTKFNNVDKLEGKGAIPSLFVPEYPTGYGVALTMSANELFLIKRYGGGLVLQGDLNKPTVISLPNLVSTGNLVCQPTNSPIGVVYGVSDGGAYVWQGQDTSTKISPQLEDDFFVIPNITQPSATSPRASFARWHDWILASNNWLFDIPSQSWWRIEDPNARRILWWRTDWTGQYLYGAISNFTNAAPEHVYTWDRTKGTSSYSWQSQPLATSQSRLANVRELLLTASGKGVVIVTITGLNGKQTTSLFTIDSTGFPVKLRQSVALRAPFMQVRIQVDSGDTTVAAPIVHGLDIGGDVREHIALGGF